MNDDGSFVAAGVRGACLDIILINFNVIIRRAINVYQIICVH